LWRTAPPGSALLPACALPLTAIAMPTPAPRRKRVSLLAISLAAFGVFWIIAYTSDHVTEAHRQTALAAFTAGIQPGGSLITPAAFQAACGTADSSVPLGDTTQLRYRDFHIYFQPGKPVDMRRATSGAWEQPMDADFVFGQLQCKGRQ
jgi:hypothetical protein